MKFGRLHVLTDFLFQQHYSHETLARLAIEGGADVIQFRQKAGPIRHKLYAAHRTARVCAEGNVPLLINDHLDIVQAVEAQGVHLGRTDFPIEDARRVLGPDAIIGGTGNTLKQAIQAWEEGADYVGFGPIYYSQSKANVADIQGLSTLEEVCQTVTVPVIAIAGITADRVPDVLAAGAYGIAVMSASSTTEDPRAATRAFRDAIDRFLA
jgi:thiamine-phosphate pyrophosphorylase